MATYQFKGLEEYARMLERLQKNTWNYLSKGVYEMAGVVANEVKNRLNSLPTVNDAYNIKAYKEGYKSKLSARQKAGLQEGFGITHMESESGYLHVKLGFDGYNDVRTETYPWGQPNAMIARSVESGSSCMDKTPFIRPATRASEKRAVERCKVVIDEEITAIMREI